MASGRPYIEAMIEGLTTLDLAGELAVTGSTSLYGTTSVYGAMGYRHSLLPAAADLTLTAGDSGKLIVFLGSNLTASLPNGAVGFDGTSTTCLLYTSPSPRDS